MPSDGTRERDLVLAPNEFAYISDQTKGNINVYVGPYKTSLANTDQPVTFNEQNKRFERCSLDQSITIFPTAPEGWYVVMKNPANDGGHPKTGTVNNLSELKIGRKVNVPGPISFALWPGQMVKVVQGHILRSNQYLVVRVYDEEAAKRDWGKAVIKPQGGGEGPAPAAPPIPDLTLGKLLVIQGTRVSFYIPPTGVEVVRDAGGHVREAVTLERLEYCILKDENGNKRYIQGPAVVFPEPTETFVERSGTRKFKAIELNEISGIYVKVIAPYTEAGKEHRIGDELFLTGKDQSIYYPRPEHAVIKYGDQEVHHAVAIPAGEGRYVLDRRSGQVTLVRGPRMLLPDPRREVIVRRVLDPKQVELWFPGNEEALAVNRRLRELLAQEQGLAASGAVDAAALARRANRAPAPASAVASEKALSADDEAPCEELGGDDFQRKTKYTAPRTLTLDTKYEGAVAVSVWTGYAVLVVSRSGERRVVTGPATHLLEYDQTLEAMELSTGTPKSDARLLKTVYVRTLHNKVSDRVSAETRDLCRVEVQLSYRVNFEGDPEKWFNVENYVKFLTDHMRSLLASAIKRHGVEEFYGNAIAIVRDAILGPPAEGGRRGREFSENGMRIYDVEVLEVKIGDEQIEQLLVGAQHEVVNQTLHVQSERRRLDLVEQTESVKREVQHTEQKTRVLGLDLQTEEVKKRLEVDLAELQAKTHLAQQTLSAKEAEQEVFTRIHDADLGRRKSAAELEGQLAQRQLERRLAELEAEVAAVTSKAKAVSPDLVAALQAFSDRALVERVSESMAPLAILGGRSVTDVLGQLLKGTPLAERVLGNGNGSREQVPTITG